ncbi:MAG: hypothetical protein JNJ73_19540 [Hyphomonadaceae bacterium]|nr:hypothetical protein [Hyphomonadaceae bacterium]
MNAVVELLVLGYVAVSGWLLILILFKYMRRPAPPIRLLTLVIEEREPSPVRRFR